MIKDELTWIMGSHLVQAGGMYSRSFDFHSRTDNGQDITETLG